MAANFRLQSYSVNDFLSSYVILHFSISGIVPSSSAFHQYSLRPTF